MLRVRRLLLPIGMLLSGTFVALAVFLGGSVHSVSPEELIQVTVDGVDQLDQHLEGANIYVGPGHEPVPYVLTMPQGGTVTLAVGWGGAQSYAVLPVLKDNTYWVDALTNQTIRTEPTPGVNKVNVVFERSFTPTFSYTFDEVAPDNPDILPADDDCPVSAPCKSLWRVDIPEGQPSPGISGIISPSAIIAFADPAVLAHGTITAKMFASWKEGPVGRCGTEGAIINVDFTWLDATADPSTTTGSRDDLCSFSHWPGQLNGVRDQFLATHPGSVLSGRSVMRWPGCLPGAVTNILNFGQSDGTGFYLVVSGDPTTPPAPPTTETCGPWSVRYVGLGVSADNPDTPEDEGGIPLRTCVAAGTHTITASLDRNDTPPGDPVVLEDSATCSPNTPAGNGVSVPLNGGTGVLGGIDMTFSQVTSAGSTTVITTTAGPPPPTGFKIVGLSQVPLYFDIDTDASYSGEVTVCIRYDESQVAGPEANLKLMHRVDSGFLDVTASVDAANHIICGATTHLSIFVVAEPVATPPVEMHKDADPSTAGIDSLANLWLCEGGTCTLNGEGELVIAERVFNANDPEGLGAYEFQLKFDHKIFDIEIEDADFLKSTGRVVNCTMTIIGENDIRFGCVSSDPTPGPPIQPGPTGSGVLAAIRVRPEPDLRYRLTPGQENSVVRTLLDENCELADIFGDPLADADGNPLEGVLPGGLLATCADAAITVRVLEGDLNLDCQVDVVDDQMNAFRYGASVGNLLYDPWFDLEPALKDMDIDIKDLQKVFGRNGSTCQSPIPAQSPMPPPP